MIEVHTSDGVAITPDIGHGERMRRVIEWGLEAIAAGRIGDPDVMQAVRVLEVQDAVYPPPARQRPGRRSLPPRRPARALIPPPVPERQARETRVR